MTFQGTTLRGNPLAVTNNAAIQWNSPGTFRIDETSGNVSFYTDFQADHLEKSTPNQKQETLLFTKAPETRLLQAETITPPGDDITTLTPDSNLSSDSLLGLGLTIFLLSPKVSLVLGILTIKRYLKKDFEKVDLPHRSYKTVSGLPQYAFSPSHLQGLRRKYDHLYDQHIRKNPDGSFSFDKATLLQREDLNVLHLKGDHFEMAFQHGRLLEQEVRSGVISLTSKKLPKIFKKLLGPNSRFYGSTSWLLNQFIHKKLLKNIPREYLEELFAMSEATLLPLYQVLSAATFQDCLHILAKYAIKDAKVECSSQANSCTSFSVWGDLTKDNEMIVGRNLDVPLNGYWDEHPTVIYFEPTTGEQKYVSFTSAGVHTAGITAYNESGIFLALHTIPSRDTSASGQSYLSIFTEVIRKARSFDEAIALLKKSKSSIAWAVHLVSTKEKRAATIEVTSKKVTVRESDRIHVQSNHFFMDEMKNRMMFINKSVDEDTLARYLRVSELLQQHSSQIDHKLAAKILSDQYDPLNQRERALENTVGVHTTIGSVILVPDQGKMYVANGTAPVSHNQYVELPAIENFDPKTFSSENYEVIDNSDWKKTHPEAFAALQDFIAAKKAYEFEKDDEKAFDLLKKVTQKDPDNSSYFFNLAILALKNDDEETAVTALSKILELGHTEQNINLANYYLGRIFAQKPETIAKAHSHLDQVLENKTSCTKLKRAAQKCKAKILKGKTIPLDGKKIGLMMQQSDVENY